jgi:hypothetical protein
MARERKRLVTNTPTTHLLIATRSQCKQVSDNQSMIFCEGPTCPVGHSHLSRAVTITLTLQLECDKNYTELDLRTIHTLVAYTVIGCDNVD